MTTPQFMTRDYSGGGQPALLINPVGAADLSFTIATEAAATWLNNANAVIGTAGQFVVALDNGTATVEKILCESVNVSSGLVTVWSSGGNNGRGYDGTTAQGHVAGTVPTTPAGTAQLCWSAEEAYEANRLVSQMLGAVVAGGVGSIPSVTSVTPPTFGPIAQLGTVPSAFAAYGAGSGETIPTLTTLSVSMTLDGGTAWSNSSESWTAPTAGDYQFNGKVLVQTANTGSVQCIYQVNGTNVSVNLFPTVSAGVATSVFNSDRLSLNEGDVVQFCIYNGTSGALTISANSATFTRVTVNYLGPTG